MVVDGRTGIVRTCVEIKQQVHYAIEAMLAPLRRLLDGVEVPRHRRDVVPKIVSARWRGLGIT